MLEPVQIKMLGLLVVQEMQALEAEEEVESLRLLLRGNREQPVKQRHLLEQAELRVQEVLVFQHNPVVQAKQELQVHLQ